MFLSRIISDSLGILLQEKQQNYKITLVHEFYDLIDNVISNVISSCASIEINEITSVYNEKSSQK